MQLEIKKPDIKDKIKFAYRKGDDFIYAIELEPQVRTIKMACYCNSRKIQDIAVAKANEVSLEESISQEKQWAEKENKFRLAFPYFTFLIGFKREKYNRTLVGLRNEPLKSIDDTLCRLPMSNIYWAPHQMGVCMSISDQIPDNVSLEEKIEAVIEQFWFTQFGSTSPFIKESNLKDGEIIPAIKNYYIWEKWSKKNPQHALKVPWVDSNLSIKTLFRDMCGLDSSCSGHSNNYNWRLHNNDGKRRRFYWGGIEEDWYD